MSKSPLEELSPEQRNQIDAEVLHALLTHLRKYPEVQNIDLMNLAYFCRNCISKWYRSAAEKNGVSLDYDQAREFVYGMPYSEYKDKHQEKATKEQLAMFAEAEEKASL